LKKNSKIGETLLQNLFLRGVSFLKRPSSFILFLVWLTSCAMTPNLKEYETSRLIENVPFFAQETFQCGPASLAGVLNYLGVRVSPEEIAMEIYSPSVGGTLNLDMILFTERKGLKAIHYKGNMDDIKKKIDAGFPMIVLVDLGLWIYQQNHFMVIVGYNENGIVANSGKDRLKIIPTKNFIKTWEKTNFWTLWITSKK
jgi:ABC-type bacteriocin/lantibiotic exporter with double-glycine peptidase domain